MSWSTWIEQAVPVVLALRGHVPAFLVILGSALQLIGLRAFILSRQPARTMVVERVQGGEQPPVFDPSVSLPGWLPTLTPPLVRVPVPVDPARLPGAPRTYRGGVHEGVDFAGAPGTPVRAAESGFVLAVEDRCDLPGDRREEVLRHCRRLGRTPGVVLDVLHGKRVVLSHGLVGGRLLTTSYSHLGEIRSDLSPGLRIEKGEVIAKVGNSGTSHAGDDGWGELHFEIEVDGLPLGLGLSPREAGALYRAAFRLASSRPSRK